VAYEICVHHRACPPELPPCRMPTRVFGVRQSGFSVT
jgi:hypothetical protein